MFFAEMYRDPPNPKMFKWVGREIEYSGGSVGYRKYRCDTYSKDIFRGRVIKVLPHDYVIVNVTHKTQVPYNIKHLEKTVYYNNLLYAGPNRFIKRLRRNGCKFPWKEIEVTLHLLKRTPGGGRWKVVEKK